MATSIFSRTSVFVLFAVFSSVPLVAQPGCFIGDDGFNVGCCNTPVPNLPNIPAITITSDYAKIQNCVYPAPTPGTVQLGAVNWFFCDYAALSVNASIPGVMDAGGTLLAKYGRTWMESDSLGLARQVWRFLVNGDLYVPLASIGNPALVPPIVQPPYFGRLHVVGHIDYSCDILVGWTAALSLNHLPGCFQFAPFSTTPIPALATGTSSYHIVGPAPFIFAQVNEPQGAIIGESGRSSRINTTPLVYSCEGEAEIGGGMLVTQSSGCLCATTGSGPWRHQNLGATVCCNGAAIPMSSIPLPGIGLPTGFVAFTLGSWPGFNIFPSPRSLVIYVGVVQYFNLCNSAQLPIHAVTGVSTTATSATSFPFQIAGVPGCFPPNLQLPTTFLDLQSMKPLSNWPNLFPGVGSLFISDLVISLNLL